MPETESTRDADFLRAVRGRLGRLHHDLNNPLAIASGNLQLVTEVTRGGADPMVADALRDASEAIDKFESLLDELLELRRLIGERLDAETGA